MLTIRTLIHLSWIVLFCNVQLSSVQGTADNSRRSTDFAEESAYMPSPVTCKSCADDQSPKWRLPRAISGDAGRSSQGVERATLSPDVIIRYQSRERKKQWRILETLMQLNGIMGSRNRTHVGESNSSLSTTEVESINQSYEEKLSRDPNLRRIITLFPTCPSSTSAKSKAFRLFFSIIPPERTIRTPVINVKSAFLHLTRKPLKADLISGKFDGSNNRKYRGKRVNAVDDHVAKWKVRIQVYNMPKGETRKAFKDFDLDPRNSTQWVKVNILQVVEEWLTTSRRNLGLQLTIVNRKNQTIDPFDVFNDFNCNRSRHHVATATFPNDDRREIDDGFAHHGSGRLLVANDSTAIPSIPHLEVVLAKAPQSSAKRIVRHLANKKNPCRMIPVLITLDDLKGKWKDNVIAPKSLLSNVCRGTCHRCLSSTGPRNGSDINGCCQPIEWRSPKALLLDDKQAIRYGDIPVLVVTKCGCRR